MNNIREANIISRIVDPFMLSAMKASGAFLAGGVVPSVFASESISDFDIYSTSETAFEMLIDEINKTQDPPSFSKTDSAWYHKTKDGKAYQLITAIYGSPDDVIARFDFT